MKAAVRCTLLTALLTRLASGYGEMTEGSIQRMLNTLKDMQLSKIGNPCGALPALLSRRAPARRSP